MQTIGRYHIEGELGKGAMGVVYKATDPNIGRVVALKTMRLDVHGIEAEEMLQRFRNEARAAGVLNHPNIVTVYDAGEADGLFFMAMEVIEGETLQQLLVKHRVLPVEQILSVTRQVGEGLDYAHARGVIHRDIKPANIMVTSSGLVKIMDFGIAKAGGGLTSTGQVLGTPNYMSPEQVKGKPLDGRTDLFSLGVVLYEMLTGEKPFGAQNVTTIIYKIVHEDPISPRELDVSIHPGLSAVVTRSLSKQQELRYQSGAELAKDLENYKSYGSDLGATQSMSAAAAAVGKTPEAARANSTTGAQAATTTASAAAAAPAPAALPDIHDTVKRPATPPRKASTPAAQSSNKGLLWGGIALLVLVIAAFGYRMTRPQPVAAPSNAATTSSPAATPANTAPGATTPASSAKPSGNTAAGTGEIVITSQPAGASVKLDGKKLSGVTPITQKDVKIGTHTLQVSAPGYLTLLRSIDVTGGASVAADVTLLPTTGTVKLSSLPPGADIFVDGAPTNKKTPADFNLSKGDHTFMVRLQGYEEAGDLIFVAPGQTLAFAPTLNPARRSEGGNPFRKMGKIFAGGGDDKGTLAVTTTPPGAYVFVNGRRVPGETPINVPVPVGNFFMAIRKPGYRPVQKALTIEKGKTTTIQQSLGAKEE